MESITSTVRQAVDAMLLRDRAYQSMRDSPNPFVQGLTFVIVAGLVVAIVSVVGAMLLRVTSPDLGAIQEAVWQGMQEMPWVEQIPAGQRPAIMQEVKRGFDLGWQVARLFAPGLGIALMNVILNPIALVIGWLIYGLLAFLSARALGGTGKLDVTYGATALAVAPRLLGVVNVLPYVETAGLGIWALICNYLAIKNTHDLSPWRSFWATIIPFILPILLAVLLAVFGFAMAVVGSGGGS